MALPAPNYTQAPNVLFDELFKTLSEGDLRVVLVLVRQTFGWHKPFDRISLSQIAEKTGMAKPSVCRSLGTLIKKGLVQKKKFGSAGQERCYYSLVMEEQKGDPVDPSDGIENEEEMELISNNSYQSPKETPPVSVGDPPSLPKRPTKETLTKENIQKKQQQASPSAAASFKSADKEKQQHPKIYPVLEDVSIPLNDKIELTSKYSLDQVKHAILWTQKTTKPIRCLAAALKWAAEAKPEIPAPKVDAELVNKAYALKYNGQRIGNAKVEVLHKTVEIDTGNSYTFFALDFSAKGFMEQFTNALRKNNFQVLPT